MSTTQAFLLGVMFALTPSMLWLAFALCRTPRTDTKI